MRTYYFVLPVFNEEGNLAAVLEDIVGLPLPNGAQARILAIDDGSTDATPAILAERSQNIPLDVVTHAPNKGIPAVFESASAYLAPRLTEDDVVIIMESDGTSDLACVTLFSQEIERGADLVIASRHIPGGSYLRFPWYRVIGSSVINLFLATLWHIPGVRDYTMFYRAYRAPLFLKFNEEGGRFLADKSFAANGELLVRLARYTKRIAEVPLRYDYGLKKGRSKMKLVATLIEYVRLTLSLKKPEVH